MVVNLGCFVNNSSQTLSALDNIVFNSVNVSSQFIDYNNGGIELKIPGIYVLNSNFDVAPTGTVAQIALYKGNAQVQGSIATETVAEAGDTANLSLNAIITVKSGKPGNYATLYFKDVTAGVVSNANVIIEKVG